MGKDFKHISEMEEIFDKALQTPLRRISTIQKKLEPGTYKITKTVLDSGASSEGDSLNRYTLSAQFLIAG